MLRAPARSGIATAKGWEGNRIAFVGDFTLLGIRTLLRQTFAKKSDVEFETLNEERRADGTWAPVDAYRYQKQP